MGVINSVKSGVRRVKNFVSPPVEISEEAVEKGAKLSLGELRKSRKDLRNAYKSWRKGEIDSEAYLEAREKNDFYRLSREKDWKNHEINTKTLSGEEFTFQQSKARRAEVNDTKYFKNNPSDVSKVTQVKPAFSMTNSVEGSRFRNVKTPPRRNDITEDPSKVAEEAKREAAEASVKTKPPKSVQEAIDKENAEKIAFNSRETFAAKSGDHFNASAEQIRGAENFGRSDEQMIDRLSNTHRNLMTDISGAKDMNEARKIAEENYGISMKEGDFWENVNKHFDDQLKSGPSIGDRFHAYHGPAIVGAGIVGASVLKMSDNRGRVPNSQLYSDPF